MQLEALVQADARAKQGAGFPVSGRAAEPMRTPPGRAPCLNSITLSDREVRGERALTRLTCIGW